jgi:transposase
MGSMTKHKQQSLFITLDELVAENHPYRQLDDLLSFDELANPFLDLCSTKGLKERGVSFGLRTLVLQFLEDISDREMERFLRENNSAKWFCELGLTEETPHHSYFGDFRKRLGTKNIMAIFQQVRENLRAMGLIREVFNFVDASHLISKITTWNDRDRSIKAGIAKFNNDNADMIAVDIQSYFINKIAATSSEVTKNIEKKLWYPNQPEMSHSSKMAMAHWTSEPPKTTSQMRSAVASKIRQLLEEEEAELDKWSESNLSRMIRDLVPDIHEIIMNNPSNEIEMALEMSESLESLSSLIPTDNLQGIPTKGEMYEEIVVEMKEQEIYQMMEQLGSATRE